MLRNILKLIIFFLIGMIGGIFADQIFWPYFVERPLFYQYSLEKAPVYVTEKSQIFIQENTALTEAIEKVEKIMVGVRTKTASGKFLEGSGLTLTSDGLFITLAELIPQGYDFYFYTDGKLVDFQVLKRDSKENLALVKIEEQNLPTIGFADLDKIKLGERVFLVGVIFDEGEPSKTVNQGIIKNFSQDYIETNITEDSSLVGSGLFNITGEIVGINMINSEGKVVTIPVSKIREFTGL